MTHAGLRFVKLSGAGNDFIAIRAADAVRMGERLRDWVRAVCRRGLSIGADGVLVVGLAPSGDVDVTYHNADGSEAFCGNGTRCAARYAFDAGLAGKSMRLVTAAGPVRAEVDGLSVRLELPPPEDLGPLELQLADTRLVGHRVRAGVPHFVVQVDDVDAFPLEKLGPGVRRHDAFGAGGTNFDVISATDGPFRLRTWERGVEGETLACGSGAVASALVIRRATGERRIRLRPAGGVTLTVDFPDPEDHVYLTGEARVVFEGSLGPEPSPESAA